MSLLPLKSLSGTLPVIFIEARLHGPPEIVFSQLGISIDADQCNIAILTRTSGVLLVASVGSYMVYRICSRLLGRNFIWTILEQARIDLIARSDTRLLNPRLPYEISVVDDSCSDLADDELSGSCSIRCRALTALISPESSPMRRRLRRSTRARQLRVNSAGDYSHQRSHLDASESALNRDGDMQSARTRSSEFSSSDKSASLRLLWDDPQWDEQADFNFYGDIVHRGQCSATSDVSDMTEFRAAKELFEESDELYKVDKDDGRINRSGNNDQQRASYRDERSSDFDANDFIQKSCMTDSQHLYQIATGYVTTTDSMSISSERSNRSFLSLRQRLTANTSSCGLLELVQCPSLNSPSEQLPTSMTDSGISKGTTASTSNLQPSIRTACMDSVFGLELFSSDDEALGRLGGTSSGTSSHRNSVIRRTSLNQISEDRCSPTTSTRSMEWFEDDYTSCTGNDLTHEMEARLGDCLTACFSCPRTGSSQGFSGNPEYKRKHLLSVSRDLMAWAREQFPSDSPQLKALQSLYTTQQRWRRIGIRRSTNCSQQFLTSLVHSMFLRGVPFFNCTDISLIAKGIHRAFSHYEFVRQCVVVDGNVGVDRMEERAICLLQTLWDVQHGTQSLIDDQVEGCCVEAVRLLTLLWILHCFEKLENGSQQCQPFYAKLFGDSNPRQIVGNLFKTQLSDDDIIIIADTLRLRLELLDCSCGGILNTEPIELPRCTENEIALRPLLTFLKFNRQNLLYPLYHCLE